MASDAHLKPVEQKYQYRKQVIWLICILSLLRLLVAGTLELTNDEAYYWLYSQQLQWNYFDHPPLVALWIRIFTANLLTQETFFLRLGSVTALAFSSWFMYQTVSTLYNERAGLFAVFMLSCCCCSS